MAEAKKLAEPSDNLKAFLDRAQKGDASTLPVLREMLQNPAFVNNLGGDLALQVRHQLIDNAGRQNLMLREALTRKLELLHNDLAGPNPTAIELLLVDRILTCWLSLHETELRFEQSKDLSFRQANYWQDRIDRAHRRYLSAIRSLATIRKLAVTVQVNISKRQTITNTGAAMI